MSAEIDEGSIRRIENERAEREKLEFVYNMFKEGRLEISEKQRRELIEQGLIDKLPEDESQEESTEVPFDQIPLLHLGKEIKSQRRGNGTYEHCGREIKTEEWTPKSNIDHTEEFVDWINSMNKDGFQEKLHYEPLELYVQQAHNWLSDNDRMDNYEDYYEQQLYFEKEFKRCSVNTLYFLDKYLEIKEPDMADRDSVKYTAKPVHEVMIFLYDCRYSIMMGKPRQVAATTTVLGCALQKLMFNKNSFVKFVTMDVDTAEEIMEDKFKYPIGEIANWFRPSVDTSSKDGLFFRRKIKGDKSKKGGANSRFLVVAPSVSAINAGSPSWVLVDEAGYIKTLGKMLREARPTMFRQGDDGKLKMVRMVWIWSTGGTSETKNRTKTKAFEEEYYFALEKWDNGDYSYGIVPIFLDWTTRPGMTREFYNREKQNYTSEGPDAESIMNQFRLTYPSSIADMFLTSAKTLVPMSFIQANEDRVNAQPAENKPTPGYFEPIYDRTKPSSEHDDVPYKIIGAKFIETELGDKRTSSYIYIFPEKGWTGRFYKGTDPISTDNGYSNMASGMWDKKNSTLAGIFNYRDENHKHTFLQCLLFGLFYGTGKDMPPELVESNIGTAYTDYVEYKGFRSSLVYRTQLPEYLRGGGNLIGIDNKGTRNRFIINKIYEMIMNYGDRMYFLQVFSQLRTFICTVTDSGRETWGTQDARRYHDDVLFGGVFSYICSICFDNIEAKHFKSDAERYVIRYEDVRDRNGNLTRKEVRKKIY